MKIGYFLSCEEWGPRDLIAQAVKAKEAGLEGFDELYVNQTGPDQDAVVAAYR